MLVVRKIEIDMGHRIPNHKSKCRNIHGHRYKIELGVDDKVITKEGNSDEGMVIDFGDMKKVLMEEIDDKYDHGFVMYKDDDCVLLFEDMKNELGLKIIFVDFIPTVEKLAEYWYNILKEKLLEKGIKIKHLKVWETPNNYTVYKE